MTRLTIAAAYTISHLREGDPRTEDGFYPVIEDFIVIAELADGTRYEHAVRFCGYCTVSEEGFGIGRAGDFAAAEALAARVDAAGSIDPARWHYHGAAYGSEAYVRDGGEEDLIAWELDQ